MGTSPGRSRHEGPVWLKGTDFRDAMVESCAQLLGKSMSTLKQEYEATLSASHGAFANIQIELAPRDLADFIVVSTLKSRNLTSIQNACAWLFNLMDRTGAGYVLRDEFIRYAPHMSPVADAAVAGTIFEQLVSAEGEVLNEMDSSSSVEIIEDKAPDYGYAGVLRRRKRPVKPQDDTQATESNKEESARLRPSLVKKDSSPRSPSRTLFPPSVAFQYPVWSKYYANVLKKYYAEDDEWVHVKREVGIDAGEILVKSEAAWVHVELLPTMGKLFLSQRYLVFFAAVGRNHYVARLGAIADVRINSIPFLMRDCFEVRLTSETHAAMIGITGDQMQRASKPMQFNGVANEKEPLSQHIGNLMRQFTAGDKPLSFSLMEFRDTSRRDNWVVILQELVGAHKLHLRMGFGSTGRASSLGNREPQHNMAGEEKATRIGESRSEEKASTDSPTSKSSRVLINYLYSPFRNEPPTPLLVVAAHANIARYRALRNISRKREPQSLLLFSHADRHAGEVSWYVDSVRQYDDWSEKSWIERLVASIQENMEANNRVYGVHDDRPFDLSEFARSIGRFAELCSPLARFIQYLNHLFQWQNPPATILAILLCIVVAVRGLVQHLPALILFGQACWVIETKMNWFGLGMGRATLEDAEQQQQNVLEMVAQVHDALQAAQNVLTRLNVFFGKVQTLCLWRSKEWESWTAVGVVLFAMLILMLVPTQILFMCLVFFMFGKHFLPPSNPMVRFWNEIPSDINAST